MSAMSGKKVSTVSHSNIVLWLLGFAALYQVAYQWIMYDAIKKDLSNDDECMMMPGASTENPQCLEMQLFRSWQRASEDDAGDHPDLLAMDEKADAPPRGHLITSVLPEEAWGHMSSAPVEVASIAVADAAKSVASKAAAQMRTQLEELFDNVSASLEASSADSLEDTLKGLQASLQARFDALPGIHRKLTEEKLAELGLQLDASERDAELDKLYHEVAESLQNRSSSTPWTKSFIDMQELHNLLQTPLGLHNAQAWMDSFTELQAGRHKRSENLPSIRHTHEQEIDRLYEETLASIHSSSNSPWTQSLVDLQGRLQKESDDLKRRHAAHEHSSSHLRGSHQHKPVLEELAKMDAKIAGAQEGAIAAHNAWEHNFSDNVFSLGKELCSDPARSASPACAAFRETTGEASVKPVKPLMTHAQWEANFTNTVAAWHHELCSDPSRHNYAVCHMFEQEAQANIQSDSLHPSQDLREQTSESIEPRPALRGRKTQPIYLQWRTVQAWREVADPHAALRELVTVSWKQVRHAHWQGMLPQVACISAIPSGLNARVHMRYFIDNFHLQTYEGPKQLILVYHHADSETARLVKKYADGTYIKGVAARGEGSFPSTAALRFGAWSSDADVIAQWDFSEFHLPHQLSMQVRAMAMTNRPASILKQAASKSADSLSDELGSGREETLAGDAGWMREHWSPLMKEERSILAGARAHQVVQVDSDL